MSNLLAVLPLALTMNLGPGIITAITLITTRSPVKKTLFYLLAILIGATTTTLAAFFIFGLLKSGTPSGTKPMAVQVMDYVFAGLLALLCVYVFINRKKSTKPKWLSTVQEADTGRIFVLGLSLYSVFPSDFVCNLTVGRYLASRGMHFYSAFTFLALTLLIAALPILSFLLFKRRAERALPSVQRWLDSNAWVVNEVVLVFFICMMLFA